MSSDESNSQFITILPATVKGGISIGDVIGASDEPPSPDDATNATNRKYLFLLSDVGASAFIDEVKNRNTLDPTGFSLSGESAIDAAAVIATRATRDSFNADPGADVFVRSRKEAIIKRLADEKFDVASSFAAMYLPSKVITAEKKLVKYIGDPITVATVYAIAADPTIDDKEDFLCIYLTLSAFEGVFNSATWLKEYKGNPTTSKGQLGFNDAAYRGTIQLEKKKYPLSPSIKSTIATFFAGWSMHYKQKEWRAQNRDLAQFDATYYLVNITLIKDHLATVDRDWSWTNLGWQPKPRISGFAITKQFVSVNVARLQSRSIGRQLLLSTYHTNGSGIFTLTKPTKGNPNILVAHQERFKNDGPYNGYLHSIPGFADYAFSTALITLSAFLPVGMVAELAPKPLVP